jgi:hypothetical protein
MIVEKVLVESVQLTNAAAVYYTTSVKVQTVITQVTLCNPTSGAATATIYLTSPGSSPGPANAIIWRQSIAGGATVRLDPMINHVLKSGGTSIQGLASANTTLTFRVSGYERAIT